MKRYIMRRKWLFLLSLVVIFSWNLISARSTVWKQELIDAVLSLEADGVPRRILFVVGINALSGAVYVASQLLQNALMVAEKANRAKGDFLSQMSHEIRTPMNVIQGMTQIAKASLENTAVVV